MYRDNGQLVYSPSDLIRFMESPFSSWMDRYNLEFPGQLTPDKDTAEEKLIQDTGLRHEERFLEGLRAKGSDIAEIDTRAANPETQTKVAMAAGRKVIYQACLALPPFRGYADFLSRVESVPGGRATYEVWDTKLARKAKPYYIVQLCCYSEMLEHLQGSRPHTLRVVLGNNEIPSFKTEDFFYYYQQLKQAFLQLMDGFDPANPPLPEPRADHGRWQSHADAKLLALDHLVQVAGITTGQIKKLNNAGITTVCQLAALQDTRVPKLSDPVLQRLVEQAHLQVQTRELRARTGPDTIVSPLYTVLPPDPEHPRRGLALLPPGSPNDVFFDMEGFPLVDDGLEYLFGVTYRDGDTLQFRDWWAHDSAQEKAAFEGFIDWVHGRRQADPSLHIYHYAAYEVSAMRRLMGRHGTREDLLDDLLRNEVFVDLYKITRQGLRIGEPSYSIKEVEHIYRGKRSGDVTDAGQSMVYYANWLESGEPRDWRQSSILRKIRDYNRDDCDSTCQLCDWLRSEQRKAGIAYLPVPEKPTEAAPSPEVLQRRQAKEKLITALSAKLRAEQGDPRRTQINQMLLHLVEFHHRESKPVWWRMYDRAAMEPEELEEDIACIGNARLLPNPPFVEKKSVKFSYKFDLAQDTKIEIGDRVRALPHLNTTMEVVHLDEDRGVITVKLSLKAVNEKLGGRMPPVTSFIPDEYVSADKLADSIDQLAQQWVVANKLPPALLRLFLREPPELAGSPIRSPGENVLDAAIRCARRMRGSTLCIQGPPGTGKTYTAARMILRLLADGRNVGITSNSHKAIENLIRECNEQTGGSLDCLYVAGDEPVDLRRACPGLEISDSAKANENYTGGLVAGTAWLFSRPEWVAELDTLFVDEAGQVSLANVAAMAPSAKNLILVGDQMQLEQPVQGSHPGESGLSALVYYLNGQATVPENLGLFLGETRRLHPEICRFVSEMVYDGRLKAAAGNEHRQLKRLGKGPGQVGSETGAHLQIVGASGGLPHVAQASQPALPPFGQFGRGAGIVFSPVEHEDNVQSSDEEVARIKEIADELIGHPKTGSDGRPSGVITLKDILFVAPYNMQVRRLREALGPGARVGSVDKFQGQEADIVILSMCSSFGHYGSRGLEFILDQNRLNVALSRARILAVVVGDPRIASTPCHTIDSMRRVNLYCRLLQEHRMA